MAGSLALQFRLHHRLAVGTALVLLAHVIWELSQTPPAFLMSMIITSDPPLLAGWLGFIIFMLAFLFSYQRQMKFRIWHSWHLLFPVAFILAAIHILAFGQEEALDQWTIHLALAGAFVSLMTMAGTAFWNPSSRRFRIHSREKLSDSVWEFLLEPEGKASTNQSFRAGQIIYLRFLGAGFSRSLHPFSVASCCLEPYLRLYIKSLGRDTSHLQDLPLHSEVDVLGPFAELKLKLDRQQIWIGGGIGIAPFLGFLHCTQLLQTPPIDVLHFVSRAEENLQSHDIEGLKSTAPALTWQTIINQAGSLPKLDALDSLLKTARQPRIVICGPNPFMRMVRRHLRSRGIAARDIITEEYKL
jgi:predicted ferric reductase